MKVKVTREYRDLELSKYIKADTVLDVSDERAKVLINAKVAVEVKEESPEEKAVAEKPKRKKSN